MTKLLFGFILLLVLAVKIVGQVAVTGFGCYDPEINECSCEEEVCNADGCEATGGMYTDRCSSCRCDMSGGNDDDGNDNNSNSTASDQEETGYGCYNLPKVGRSCTCTEDVCSEATCTGTLHCDILLLYQLCS
jgi:hypothetical protein